MELLASKIVAWERAPALPRYGAILVHASLCRASAATSRYAAEVANLSGARLIGVSSLPERRRGPVSEVQEDAQRRVLEAAGASFTRSARGVRAGADWTCGEGPRCDALAGQAWAADLIVTHTREPGGADLRRLALRSDRAVLAPPSSGALRLERAMVLWTAHPVGRRAVRSALPLLGRSRELTIVSRDGRAEALEQGLALRGFKGQVRILRRPATRAAHRLLVRELEPDLLVLGLRRVFAGLADGAHRACLEEALSHSRVGALIRSC